MTDLAASREQLEKAVARLEAALAARPAGSADPAVDKALEEARTEYRNLRKVADTVSRRIDGVLDRLRATLDEG